VGIYPQDGYGSREGLVRILKTANDALVRAEGKGVPKRGGGAARLLRSKPAKLKFKKHFIRNMISKVLRDFPFSRNQPLKSADDQYIRILKNKLIQLKKPEDRTL
jgi:hypothetical protein